MVCTGGYCCGRGSPSNEKMSAVEQDQNLPLAQGIKEADRSSDLKTANGNNKDLESNVITDHSTQPSLSGDLKPTTERTTSSQSKKSTDETSERKRNNSGSNKSMSKSGNDYKASNVASKKEKKETTRTAVSSDAGLVAAEEAAPEEDDVVNVNQFYPEIDIITSTLLTDSNVAEEEDHKFGGVELATAPISTPPSTGPQVLVLGNDGSTEKSDTDGGDVDDKQSLHLSDRGDGAEPQFVDGGDGGDGRDGDYNNSADRNRPQNQQILQDGFGVFSATQIRQEKVMTGRLFHNGYSISPDLDMTEIINSRAAEHYMNAMRNQDEGNLEKAILCINKAMGLRPNNSVYFIQRAEIFLDLSDFQSAILNYKKACFLEPDDNALYCRLAFIFYFQGQVLFDQRLYAEALEAFSRASEMMPVNIGYHTRSIACLAALQRHGECLALVNRRLETEKNNPDLFVMRARLHEMFRNMTLCYYDVKDALSLDPEHPEAMMVKQRLEERAEENKVQSMQLNILGKLREALQKISIAIEMNPAVAEFHVLRGALQRKLGDFNAAIDDFLLALDKTDHDEESKVYCDSQRQLLLTYNDFSVECFTKGYYEEAVMLLNKAIKGEKTEKGLYINRGDCFFRQGDLTFALQDYHQALELDGLDDNVKSRISVIHNEFGVNAYQDKNFPEAEAKFSLAIQYNPRVGQYYISRSRSRYMLEDMMGARQDLLMGLHLDPSNEEILSILSRLFPGKSVAEVMNSRMSEAAKLALGNLIPTASPVRLQPIPIPSTPTLVPMPQPPDIQCLPCDLQKENSSLSIDDRSAGSKSAPLPREASQDSIKNPVPPTRQSLIRAGECETPQLITRIAQERKKIRSQMKAALHERKSLKDTGPKLTPLPPQSGRATYGGRNAPRKESVIVNPVESKKSTNWKKFNVGVGV